MTAPEGPTAVQSRRLIPLDDVAADLSVTRRTVERLIAAGELQTVKIGRRRFCTPGQIDQFVAGLVAES